MQGLQDHWLPTASRRCFEQHKRTASSMAKNTVCSSQLLLFVPTLWKHQHGSKTWVQRNRGTIAGSRDTGRACRKCNPTRPLFPGAENKVPLFRNRPEMSRHGPGSKEKFRTVYIRYKQTSRTRRVCGTATASIDVGRMLSRRARSPSEAFVPPENSQLPAFASLSNLALGYKSSRSDRPHPRVISFDSWGCFSPSGTALALIGAQPAIQPRQHKAPCLTIVHRANLAPFFFTLRK